MTRQRTRLPIYYGTAYAYTHAYEDRAFGEDAVKGNPAVKIPWRDCTTNA